MPEIKVVVLKNKTKKKNKKQKQIRIACIFGIEDIPDSIHFHDVRVVELC